MQAKVLGDFVAAYEARHKRLPERILIEPTAAVVLGMRKDLPTLLKGVPVACRKLHDPGAGPARSLGVLVHIEDARAELRSCDLDYV